MESILIYFCSLLFATNIYHNHPIQIQSKSTITSWIYLEISISRTLFDGYIFLLDIFQPSNFLNNPRWNSFEVQLET